MCIIFIGSAFIYPETCPRVLLHIFSGPYPKYAYVFASPAGLWKVVARVSLFAISPVFVNTWIGFKIVPQVWHFWWIVGNIFINITEDFPFVGFQDKRYPKGHQGPLGWPLEMFWRIIGNWFINITENCSFCWVSVKVYVHGEPRPIGLIPGKCLVGFGWLIYKHNRILFLLLGL